MSDFPSIPPEQNGTGRRTDGEGPLTRREEAMASESARYECESCGSHFCIDCDLFCHEVVHNCPGCLGGGAKAVQVSGRNGIAVANGDSEG